MNNEKKVFNLRKKIFKCKKYNKYNEILYNLFIQMYYDYKSCIPVCFSNLDYDKINIFKQKEYLDIYNKVLNDISIVNKQKLNKNVLFIIHPFYPLLRHSNFLIQSDYYLKQYIAYEKKITKILKFSKRDIVLVDSPDSFMNYTYKFLKYRRIKRVLLTRHSEGFLLNKDDIDLLKNVENASLIGCYKNRCISDFESEISLINYKKIDSLIFSRFEE